MIWINGKHMKRLIQDPFVGCISSGVKKTSNSLHLLLALDYYQEATYCVTAWQQVVCLTVAV